MLTPKFKIWSLSLATVTLGHYNPQSTNKKKSELHVQESMQSVTRPTKAIEMIETKWETVMPFDKNSGTLFSYHKPYKNSIA